MSLTVDNKENSVDSALFLSPLNSWKDVVVAMKPGAHLLLFNNVKNHHLGAIAAEDAGLEIRDTLAYVFAGSENDVAMKLISMARKPLQGTVAENVLRWGTGGLNIDGCRVSGEPWKAHKATGLGSVKFFTEGNTPIIDKVPHDSGRWPANLVHDNSPSVTGLFPNSKTSRIEKPCPNPEITGHKWGSIQGNRGPRGYDGDGSAARFFYSAPCFNDLLAYLIKLVTPHNGTVLTNCDLTGLPGGYKYLKDYND